MFRAGQDEAFRAIHDRYRGRLFSYARQMLPGRQDAEDALQDVFLRAYAGLRASDRELALRAWLYRVAHNRCIDELRRPVSPPPERVELCPTMDDPVAHADRRESLRRLIGDIRRLPDQQRSALLMRELGGMSYADVAVALGISVPAVKSLLVRARIGLVQAIEARDTACSEIRTELMLAHDRRVRPGARARRHMRDCAGCRDFRRELRGVSRQLAALGPALGPLGVLAKLLGFGTGGGAAASGGSAAASGAMGSTGAATSAGALASGVGHVATLLAATVVAAGGAVELQHTIAPPRVAHHATAKATSHSAASRRVSEVAVPEQGTAGETPNPAAAASSAEAASKPPASRTTSSASPRSTGTNAGTSGAPTHVTSGIALNDQLAGSMPGNDTLGSTSTGTGSGLPGTQGGTSTKGTTPPTGGETTIGTGGSQGGAAGGGCTATVTVCQSGTPPSGSFGGGTNTGGTTGGGTSGGGTPGGGTGSGGGSSVSAP